MPQLFGRKLVLRIGDKEWRGLRVAFSVRRSLRKRPNLARSIRVYGLNLETIGAIAVKGALVQLTAGYESTAEVIFTGQLSRFQVVDEGADHPIEITARDGGAAWRKSVSRAFGGATTIRAIVEEMAKEMGLTVSPTVAASITGSTRGSTVMRGYARDTLDITLRSAGYEWSIQDGALQVIKNGSALRKTAVVLSSETGMIGSPRAAEKGNGWIVESLMQPKLKPGRTVILRSKRTTGTYRITAVEHAGDTHSENQWKSIVELREV